jgi:SAM-dependent methyltransferase
VLEHPRYSPLTFPFEWTPSIFKAAALTVLELNIRLLSHGYCTIDGHPWNIMLDGLEPRFVDFTSIIRRPAHGCWEEINEFAATCLGTLRLMAKGYPTVARALLRDLRSGPDPVLANSVLVNSRRRDVLPRGLRELAKARDVAGYFANKLTTRWRYRGWGRQGAPVGCLHRIADEIRALDVQPPAEMWSDYYRGHADVGQYDGTRSSLDGLRRTSRKHEVVCGVLERLRPASVLDVACNRGPFSQFAALSGARVIGIDIDESALDAMARDSVALRTRALPLFCNIVTPAEPTSMAERVFPRTAERLRSECVLCLALVHHLVFRQTRLRFENIARILAALTTRHLIVEFIPREDRALAEFNDTRDAEFLRRFDWYSLENFRAALSPHFPQIEVLDSHPAPRVLLVCSR